MLDNVFVLAGGPLVFILLAFFIEYMVVTKSEIYRGKIVELKMFGNKKNANIFPVINIYDDSNEQIGSFLPKIYRKIYRKYKLDDKLDVLEVRLFSKKIFVMNLFINKHVVSATLLFIYAMYLLSWTWMYVAG
ncbi:MAG: hypothetical protein QM489_06005 [Candidatus Izemoplasma sp.]